MPLSSGVTLRGVRRAACGVRPGPSAASGAEASVWPLLLPLVAGGVSGAAGGQWPYILGG